MDATNISLIVIFAGFPLAIAIFDVFIIMKKGKQSSISAYLIRLFKNHPLPGFLLGFILGMLGGHLFWSMSSFDYMEKDKLIEKCNLVLKKKVDNGL